MGVLVLGGILRGGMNGIPVCSRSSRKENTCKSNMTTKTVSAANRNGNHASRHDWLRLERPTSFAGSYGEWNMCTHKEYAGYQSLAVRAIMRTWAS